MIINIKTFFCNFVGTFLLVLALFMAIAPWDWITILIGRIYINHGVFTGIALLLFLLAIIAFRKFDFYDTFISNDIR
jgi:hypothetical protein